MRLNLRSVLFFMIIPLFSFSQNAGSAVRISASEVIVAHHPQGALNSATNHTLELWFKADEVQSDQKLVSKIDGSLSGGYILGIQNGTIKYELFNAAGVKQELIAGSIQANQWTHLAVTYLRGGKIKMYVNGTNVGEINDDDTEMGSNTSNFVIGTSSWDIGALDFTGEIDEVRFWHGELSEQTLNKWMVRNVDTDNHPNKIQLQLYHKYDTGEGTAIVDHSNQTINTGTLSTANWRESTVPFKGTQWFASTGPEINGIWVGHNNHTLGNLTVSGVNLSGDQSVVLESNTENIPNSICGHTVPENIEHVSCLFWHMISQDNPIVSFSIDVSGFDLTNREIFLLESTDVADFTGGAMITGTLNGSTFEVTSHTVNANEGMFYTIGFTEAMVGTTDLSAQNIAFQVSPNPSNGLFQINIETEDTHDFQLSIMDYSGKLLVEKQLNDINTFYQEDFNLSDLPTGLYFVRLKTAEGLTTRKLLIE